MKLKQFIFALVAILSGFSVSAWAQTTVTTEIELTEALKAGGKVILGNDITLTEMQTIPVGVSVTLDLNGKTISLEKEQTAGYQMILNDGSLTIKDSSEGGKLSYTDTGNGGEYISDVIYNRGVLIINGGTIENLSSATVAANGYPHAVDTYSGIRNTSVTINGGTISCSSYSAIRMFCVSPSNTADLVINGGIVNGAIDMQNGIKDVATGSLKITDGAFYKKSSKANVRFANWNGGATEFGIVAAISGGVFDAGINTSYVPASANFNAQIISGGTFGADVTAYCAEGFACQKNADGTFCIVKANAGLSGDGTEASPYLIQSVDDLVLFRNSVNAGETTYNADGVYVALAADINMADVDWSMNIGDDCANTFDGIFDGKDHTIKNLKSEETAQKTDGYICTGLFGAIGGNAVVKNFTIENVTINTGDFTGNNVAAVVGFAYNSTGTIEDVTICGNVNINAKNVTGTAAIVGYAYKSSMNIKNCKVSANESSVITGAAYVGGIIGYSTKDNLEGNSIENIDVIATSCAAGGVAGIMLSGGVVIDNTIKNVDLTSTHANWKNSAAIVVGTITNQVTISGTIFENVTANGESTSTLVGSAYAEKPATPVAKVQARNGDKYFTTLEDALAAEGDNVEFLVPYVVAAGETKTLDLNGKTVSQSKECTASYDMILNKGNLTIKKGTISFTDTSEGDSSFGWGSYTVRNEGTLVVEDDATIEHLGKQAFATHMICAIFQYSGSTTINGGKISTPNYRSIRLWKGDMTINGGTFDGQLWVQAVDNSAELTINAGTFEPNGNDASSVFVENDKYDVEFAVAGGTFNGKIGCSDATKLAGAITGGKFTEKAMNATNSALLASGFVFGEADTDGYYKVEDDPATHYIATLEDLKALRDAVNSGTNYYAGVNVYLTADIDLAGENWVGIGSVTADHGFMGNFDGNGYKIKNLTITDPALDSDGYAYAGLFAVTEGTDKDNQNTIKNLIIENATIKTTGHIVSAAIAYPYYTIVENVNVCGDIAITGGDYTAGVLAYTRRCVNASNLTIVGSEGSYVKGNQTIGGVISDIQMNGGLIADYKNFSAEGLSITGTKQVGGISGIIANQTLNGAAVKNVTLKCDDARVGIVAGALGGTSTISTVVTENVIGATALIGATYDDAKAVVAKIGNTYYASFEKAYEAAKEGDIITMLAPVVIAAGETLTLDKDVAITYTSNVAGEDMFTNRGTLNISAGTITYVNTDATGSNVTVSTISSEPGSVLNITDGKVENKTVKADGSSIYSYAIDMLTNGSLGDVTATIEGGTIHSDYMAIRQFNNGDACKNTLNITGGYIYGAKRAVQVHLKNNAAYTTISGGKIEGGDYSLCFLTTSENLSVVGGEFIGDVWYSGSKGFISGGTYANEIDAAYCAEGYILTKNDTDGYYEVVEGTYVAKIGDKFFITLEDALAAEGDNVELLVPYVVAAGETKTLDLNGKIVTGTPSEAKAYAVITNNGTLTITNGTVVCNHTLAGSTGYAVNTITNCGTLTIDGATVKNISTASNQIGYAIDNNSTSANAIVTIKSGEVTATGSSYYDGIRQFCNSLTNDNSVVVNGGEVSTIWMQNPSDGAEKNTKDVKGSIAIHNGNVGILSLEPSTNFKAVVDGGYVGEISYFQQADNRNLVEFVTGGTFGMDVTEFCAQYHSCTSVADGKYEVKPDANYIAEYIIDDAKGEDYTSAENKVVGTLTYKRTLPNVEKWNPLYVPFAIPMSKLIENYDVAYFNDVRGNDADNDNVVDDGTLKMELVMIDNPDVTLNPNYPFVFRAKTEEAKNLELVLDNATLYANTENSVVFTSLDIKCEVKGSYSKCKTGDNQYIVNTNGLWSPLNQDYYLKPYRLILTLSSNNNLKPFAARDIRMFVIGEEAEDGTTHIFDVENDAQTQDSIYDLQGRRVLTPQKGGLYIVNGKKTVIR